MEKLLPHNIEAECGVLGSIIMDPEAIVQVVDFLHERDFYREAHRMIYETIYKLYQEHEPADFITLCDELRRHSNLEEVGGASYITSLINQVPTSANIEYYARIVERTAVLRRLIHAAGQIAATAYENTDANEALARAEQLIYAVRKDQASTDFASDSSILHEYRDDLSELRAHAGTVIGVPTGFSHLDFYLGGMQRSDLLLLAARPGMGKSAMMLNMAYNVVHGHNRRVAIFSCEMSKKQLMQRMVSRDTHIELYRLRNGQLDNAMWEQVEDSVAKLSTEQLWIDDTGNIAISDLQSRARRLHAREELDLIIVDYLQLMKGHNENRVLEIGEITQGLKALAKELDIPILALAQLSRAVETRADKTPQLSDLRESGSLENDADVVMFIYRDEYYNANTTRPGIADIVIAKHRNGPTGEVQLGFDARFTQFMDIVEGKMLQ